jgi:ribonuclease D
LLADLKDWRLRTSKDMSVPAYVVFTDNTLIAIAETLPTDDAALVAIPGIGRASSSSSARMCSQWSKAAKRRKDDAKPAGQKIGCANPLLPLASRSPERTRGGLLQSWRLSMRLPA